MTEHDYERFSEWFEVLAVSHRMNASEHTRGQMKAEYFDVLQSYPFDAVEFAYQNLRRKMKKWPVPADWLENLPPFGNVNRLEVISAEDLRETQAAEALGYEQRDVCRCAICQQELAAPLQSRFVPRQDRDGHPIERRHPGRVGRAIMLGRWIHGDELRRWYFARQQFYDLKKKLKIDLDTENAAQRSSPHARMERLVTEAKAQIAEQS